MNRGKFIAIEGVDGSGKATQTKLSISKLKENGFSADGLTFPAYGKWSSIFVEKFLNKEFGEMNDLDPFISSSFYALDRFGQKNNTLELLQNNDFVISDRYGTSSFLHRGTQYLENNDMEGLDKFFSRLYDLEYVHAGLPEPDLIVFLSLSLDNVKKLLDKKANESRDYLQNGKKLDIAESDVRHQELALKVGNEILPKYFKNYVVLKCDDENGILPIEVINTKLVDIIKNM